MKTGSLFYNWKLVNETIQSKVNKFSWLYVHKRKKQRQLYKEMIRLMKSWATGDKRYHLLILGRHPLSINIISIVLNGDREKRDFRLGIKLTLLLFLSFKYVGNKKCSLCKGREIKFDIALFETVKKWTIFHISLIMRFHQ